MSRSLTLGTVVMLLAMSMAGCIKQDPNLDSPLGPFPKITVDFIDNVTKIYVKALTDTRYSNMTIRVFHGNVTYSVIAENNTYMMHQTVSQKEFTLNATVIHLKRNKISKYCFEADFTVRPSNEPNVLLRVSIDQQDGAPIIKKFQESDLPWNYLGDQFQ